MVKHNNILFYPDIEPYRVYFVSIGYLIFNEFIFK